MDNLQSHLKLLIELESRHDELIAGLAALDKKVEQVLTSCMTAGRETASSDCAEELDVESNA
jgi:hypothetical protein